MGRPAQMPKMVDPSFRYQAKSWDRARRVVAQVEWPAGELCPRLDFVVTTVPRCLFATILERIDYRRAIPGAG